MVLPAAIRFSTVSVMVTVAPVALVPSAWKPATSVLTVRAVPAAAVMVPNSAICAAESWTVTEPVTEPKRTLLRSFSATPVRSITPVTWSITVITLVTELPEMLIKPLAIISAS